MSNLICLLLGTILLLPMVLDSGSDGSCSEGDRGTSQRNLARLSHALFFSAVLVFVTFVVRLMKCNLILIASVLLFLMMMNTHRDSSGSCCDSSSSQSNLVRLAHALFFSVRFFVTLVTRFIKYLRTLIIGILLFLMVMDSGRYSPGSCCNSSSSQRDLASLAHALFFSLCFFFALIFVRVVKRLPILILGILLFLVMMDSDSYSPSSRCDGGSPQSNLARLAHSILSTSIFSMLAVTFQLHMLTMSSINTPLRISTFLRPCNR
mmetsp:Transcript_19764/g.37194  ORF Transcript_19764/g.37194 Transcript_19764/m.37194 type:complete len:264 (-) Transcript_19764:205-996(-)